MSEEAFTLDEDFNLEEDYKPTPVIPAQKNLNADIVKSVVDTKRRAVVLDVTLHSNDDNLFCDDNETPVNGQTLDYSIWLPTHEDKDKRTASGKQSKWQWKVNNLKENLAKLGVNAQTPAEIKAACEDGSFLKSGIKVDVGVEILNGRPINRVEDIKVG